MPERMPLWLTKEEAKGLEQLLADHACNLPPTAELGLQTAELAYVSALICRVMALTDNPLRPATLRRTTALYQAIGFEDYVKRVVTLSNNSPNG